MIIDTSPGLLLKPTAAFKATQLADVAGMLKGIAKPKTDVEIAAALKNSVFVDVNIKTHPQDLPIRPSLPTLEC